MPLKISEDHVNRLFMKQSFPLGKKMRVKKILAGFLCCAAISQSWAGLVWQKPKVEFTAPLGAEVVRTSYAFINSGTTSVSIVQIKPSCGCVGTNLKKLVYAPGESGLLKVTLDLSMDDFSPLEDRTIMVVTNDAPNLPTTLQLLVHVPETVSASPEAVVWKRGESPKAKEVTVKAGSGIKAIKLIQTTWNDNFSVEVKSQVPGQSYRVKITPKNTGSPSYATLVFDVKSPSFRNPVDCQVRMNIE
jgi:hypothetical protein